MFVCLFGVEEGLQFQLRVSRNGFPERWQLSKPEGRRGSESCGDLGEAF